MNRSARTHVDGAPLALTMGEPAGIGAEITLKAWGAVGVPPFFVIDDAERLGDTAQRLGLAVPVRSIDGPEDATAVFADALPVLPCTLPAKVDPGRPDPANGAAVWHAVERAVGLVGAGRASAVVTNPIHKNTLYQAGFTHAGHTEFLGHLAGNPSPIMMLACEDLRVVPVTVHISLRDAMAALTTDAIVVAGTVAAHALANDFAIDRPRLAVAGLNPHAGEDGAMGAEEQAIIAPAVSALRAKGIDARGPLPADTLFHAAARPTYDTVLCMYHDQALIPIKTIAFDRAVNVTLGLPFVRTSPDHGTALNIAGRGIAMESSLVAALKLAASMAAHRTDGG